VPIYTERPRQFESGARRIVRKFLLFPKRLQYVDNLDHKKNGQYLFPFEWRWLMTCEVVQEYQHAFCSAEGIGMVYFGPLVWFDIAWR